MQACTKNLQNTELESLEMPVHKKFQCALYEKNKDTKLTLKVKDILFICIYKLSNSVLLVLLLLYIKYAYVGIFYSYYKAKLLNMHVFNMQYTLSGIAHKST